MRIAIMLFMVSIVGIGLTLPTNAQTATPPSLATIVTSTPVPTLNVAIDVPRSELYQSMATAAANINSLPNDIRNYQGINVLPNSNTTQLFGYAKWLFSANTAREALGNTFAPIGINLFVLFVIGAVIAAVYLVVNLVVLIVRFVIWVLSMIFKFLGFLG